MPSRRLAAATIAAALSVVTASAVGAADPLGTGHGDDVSAVAKAVETTQGNAHGKAVSAIAKQHGAEVSAAARARAAEKKAAGKAKAEEKSEGKASTGASNKDAAPSVELPAAPGEPGGIKDDARP